MVFNLACLLGEEERFTEERRGCKGFCKTSFVLKALHSRHCYQFYKNVPERSVQSKVLSTVYTSGLALCKTPSVPITPISNRNTWILTKYTFQTWWDNSVVVTLCLKFELKMCLLCHCKQQKVRCPNFIKNREIARIKGISWKWRSQSQLKRTVPWNQIPGALSLWLCLCFSLCLLFLYRPKTHPLNPHGKYKLPQSFLSSHFSCSRHTAI
jgi:hypothetical protein